MHIAVDMLVCFHKILCALDRTSCLLEVRKLPACGWLPLQAAIGSFGAIAYY